MDVAAATKFLQIFGGLKNFQDSRKFAKIIAITLSLSCLIY
jgi:hypothetical protein